jgi:hypothetical protein
MAGMSTDTKQLIEICEQLPQAQRVEVADFARFLLTKNRDTAPRREATERWLASAYGAAKPGITTDQVMALTRGEA